MTGSDGAVLRVAVVGAGAFGRNHLRVYRELEQARVMRLSWWRWWIAMRACGGCGDEVRRAGFDRG